MNAPAPVVERDVHSLERSFEAFTRISRALELAYDRLREQAARVDLALAESNRRLAEKVEQLDATTSHLDAVLASLKTAVIVTDLDGRVTLANQAFAELAGADAGSLVGKLRRELADDRGAPLCEPDGSEGGASAAGGRALALPHRAIRVKGERRIVRSSRAPVATKEGRVLGEVELIVDESEVETLREELRRRETLTALGEMAAGIAHELRNPLTAVEGFASLLAQTLPEGTEASADQRNHVRRIRQGVDKANAIIANLLCFARPERFRPRRSRLATLFGELRASFVDGAANLAKVEVRAPEPAELEVACDLALIERVLTNLVENARLAAGAQGRVVVRARAGEGEVVLTVEDDGPGIAEELRTRLFRPFVTGRAEGTGLGLFLVHRIVELHHGRVDAGDRVGGGTTFTVHLPDSRPEARAARDTHLEGTSA
jgi:PAS domain S-box-containing protein